MTCILMSIYWSDPLEYNNCLRQKSSWGKKPGFYSKENIQVSAAFHKRWEPIRAACKRESLSLSCPRHPHSTLHGKLVPVNQQWPQNTWMYDNAGASEVTGEAGDLVSTQTRLSTAQLRTYRIVFSAKDACKWVRLLGSPAQRVCGTEQNMVPSLASL